MNRLRSVSPLLVVLLALIGLVRPAARIILTVLGVETGPALPIGLTVVITLVWAIVVGRGRAPQPLLTLVLAGLAYGVLAILLSGVLSPIIDGELAGPLANPIAIVPVLLTGAVWGLVAGGLALLVRRLWPARGATRPADAGRR